MAMAASSSRDVTVVGGTFSNDVRGGPSSLWAIHWDGSAWSKRQRLPLGFQGYGNGGLYAAHLAPPHVPWTVGVDDCSNGCFTPLVARYARGRWRRMRVPTTLEGCDNPALRDRTRNNAGFYDLSVLDARGVWVGGFSDACGIVGRWDGRRWHVAKVVGQKVSRITALAVLNLRNVWAIGSIGDPEVGAVRTFLLHFDGRRWSFVKKFANPEIEDVAALNSGDVWAVGRTSLHRSCVS